MMAALEYGWINVESATQLSQKEARDDSWRKTVERFVAEAGGGLSQNTARRTSTAQRHEAEQSTVSQRRADDKVKAAAFDVKSLLGHSESNDASRPGKNPTFHVSPSAPPVTNATAPTASSNFSRAAVHQPRSIPTDNIKSPREIQHAMTSLSGDVTTTPEKFNPFFNSPPLTADIDTNRLYPRINRSMTTSSPNDVHPHQQSTSRHLPPKSQPVHQPPRHQHHHLAQFVTSSCSSVGGNIRSALSAHQSAAVAAAAAAAVEHQLKLVGLLSLTRRRLNYDALSNAPFPVHPLSCPALGTHASAGSLAQQGRQATGVVPSAHRPASRMKCPASAPSCGRHACPACGKTYSTVSGLTKHREFHCRSTSGGQPSTKAAVASSAAAAAAAAAAREVLQQRCPHCDKCYASSSTLKMHIRTHTLPCRCRLCGKAFSRPWLLQGHLRTHTGEKPFGCPHCQRAFADRSNLRAHLQTHYDVKQYNCDVCRRTFSRMSLLLKHRYGACASANASVAVQRGNAPGMMSSATRKRDDLQLVQGRGGGSSRVLTILNI